ncbi:MAG TPA: ERF family protein [Planctomycetes bacterium]|nr:ERF family protein [Planctomycetota bacterium]
MINHSEQISNLAAALLKAQKDIHTAVKSNKNPFFKSSYAPLEAVIDAIKGPLNQQGIVFLQAVDANGNGPMIDTILLHESGQFMSSRTPVFCNKPNDPQAFGSGVTYSKRYALQAILGLPTADDDGEGAMGRNATNSGSTKAGTLKELTVEAYTEFVAQHADDIGENLLCDMGLFKTELWTEIKRKHKTQKAALAFAWTKESLKPFVDQVKFEKTLRDKDADA